ADPTCTVDPNRIEIVVSKHVQTFFGAFIERATVDVSGRAVADRVTETSGPKAAVFAMSTACPAITLTGNPTTFDGELVANGGFGDSGRGGSSASKLLVGKYSGKHDTCYDPGHDAATFDPIVSATPPLPWPVTPPATPTDATCSAANHCTKLTAADISSIGSTWCATHPAGIYWAST